MPIKDYHGLVAPTRLYLGLFWPPEELVRTPSSKGEPISTGPNTYMNTRILRSSSRPGRRDGGFQKLCSLCGILMFLWSLGPLYEEAREVVGSADHGTADWCGFLLGFP